MKQAVYLCLAGLCAVGATVLLSATKFALSQIPPPKKKAADPVKEDDYRFFAPQQNTVQ